MGSYINIPFDIFGRNEALSAFVLDPVRNPLFRIEGITQFDITPKFNDISEIQFEVQRYIMNESTLEIQENAAYKYLHTFAQIYVPELGDHGYFIIHEEPTIVQESTAKEAKTFTAMGYESVLEYESLVSFSINCGTEESKEMTVDGNLDALEMPIEKIRLYDSLNPDFSLMHWVLKDDYYGWSVGHVDTSIAGLERSFEIDNQTVYSFLHADVSQAFRCIFDFDTKHKVINIYDIERIGNDTNIYLSIEHYLNQIQIAPHSDSIYTVFNVSGGDDNYNLDGDGVGLEYVNFGSSKIVNIDYPLSIVSSDLYDKYKRYETYREGLRDTYIQLNKQKGDIENKMVSLLDRQPQDQVNNNWSSTVYYSMDDLQATLGAMRSACSLIESLFTDRSGQIDWDELNLSAEAAIYHSYNDVCIPDIVLEIARRQGEDVPDDGVESEFVWELYGLNDLETEIKKLEESVALYEEQGYDGTWEESGYLDQDEFNAHHQRYLLLKQKITEAQDLFDQKMATYEGLKSQAADLQDQIEECAHRASLEGSGYFTANEIRQIKELYRESDYTNSNFILTDYDDLISAAEIQRQLLDDAKKQLEKESRPQYEWQVNANDLFAMEEFKPLQHQLQVGDFVWLGKRSERTVDKQKFRIVEMKFSGLKENTSFTIQFSTMIETHYSRTDFEELLDNAISSSVNSMQVGVNHTVSDTAKNVMNSLIKPYLEVMNAKIDNLEIQNVTAQDLKATSALIDHLTVFDLMAGEITADKSITLTSREGYGSIDIVNSTMIFKDANETKRVVIGRDPVSGEYIIEIYNEQGRPLWGSNGVTQYAIANNLIVTNMINSQAITTEKVQWNGISEDVDDDGKPVWAAEKVIMDTTTGERLPEVLDNLRVELSSIEIVASSQMFIDDNGTVTPSSITLTPVLHIINNMSLVEWSYKIGSGSWQPVSGLQGVTVDNNKVLTIVNTCPAFTGSNNSIMFKAAYIEDGSQRFYDLMSVYRLSNAEGGGGGGTSSYSVILSNEAQTVATDSDRYPVTDDVYTCNVRVFKGISELFPANAATLLTNTFSVAGTCSIGSVSVDTTSVPGTVSVTLDNTIPIPSNFEVVLTITIPELESPIERQISFSASAAGESPVLVTIDSSSGNIFKGRLNQTTLTCTVAKGTEDVTGRVTKFKWTKRDQYGNPDPSWTRELSGNTIVITADDVTGKAVFSCEVSFE